MTVSLTNAEVKLLGNGTTTQWPLGFELTDANGLTVSVWDSSGNETVLDLYTDYSVSDIGSELGATITYPLLGAALPDGEFLYVKRTTDLTQQMDGGAEQELNAQQIVAQIDKMAMQIQELKAQLSRTLRMATTAGTEFVATPNSFFGTDSSGRPALLSDYVSSLTVVSGAIVWESPIIVDFINDTTLGYSGGASVQVASGDLIRAGGYRYQVLDGAAGSFTLESAGGVRVLALDTVSAAYTDFFGFMTAASANGYGVLSPGSLPVPAVPVSSVNKLTIEGSAKSAFTNSFGYGNLLSFYGPQYLSLKDVTVQGAYPSTSQSGHGLVLRDADYSTIFDVRFTGFGGQTADNGGAAILAYPNDGSTPLDFNTYIGVRATGASSQKDFGLVLASARYNIVMGCSVQTMSNWGLEFKNNSVHNVMGLSTAYHCRYSFGIGFEGAVFGEHNAFGLLASRDSDIGFHLANAKHNIAVGLNLDCEAQPDTFGDGNAYGVHIEANSDENVVGPVITTGAIMDYPVRLRASRNAVSIADYSSAAKSITIESSAEENYIELLHPGSKSTDARSLVTDGNGVWSGAGANVFDSPVTRQYFGSVSGSFTWGLDGLSNSYLWGSFPNFRFEGLAGETVLGLGAKSGKQAGLVVTTAAAATEARMVYQFDATPYWRIDADETQLLRIDTTAISPITDSAINLGKDTQRFNNAYFTNFKFQPPTTLGYTLANGEVTITRPSNTQLRFHVKGSDGVTRTATLTLA